MINFGTFNVSRSQENEFPKFTSVEEARLFFETEFKGEYRRGGWERLDSDMICYFDELNHQPVQIMAYDDGQVFVHVVY